MNLAWTARKYNWLALDQDRMALLAAAEALELRASLVVLLLAGAYFASHPWTTCAFAMGPRWEPTLVRICSFGTGDPVFDRTGPGPLWPYPLCAAIYLFAALAVAFTRRISFGAATRT